MDFLLRPVSRGFCRYESLLDGSLTLEDMLIMNQYIDNERYNQSLIQERGLNRE